MGQNNSLPNFRSSFWSTTAGINNAHDALGKLCRPPRGDASKWAASPLQADKFVGIANLLKHTAMSVPAPSMIDFPLHGEHPRTRWYTLPRTYAILRNINGLCYMDDFIAHEFTDLRLPYTDETLPSFVDNQTVRRSFLQHQNYALTNARAIEIPDGQHVNLDENADSFFVRIRDLGHGSFGSVDVVVSKLGLRQYARKRVLRGQAFAARKRENVIFREIALLKELPDHRHVIRLVSSYADKISVAYLMEPTAECTLFDLLGNRELAGQHQTSFRYFYGCLAGAVQFLHANGVTHSDLSTRNILIKDDKRLVVSDLGAALNMKSVLKNSQLGTPWYEAPERRLSVHRHSSMDMWSLGVIFLEMTTVLLQNSVSGLEKHIEKYVQERRLNRIDLATSLPAVQTWLQSLSSNITPVNNIPISWVQALMRKKPEQRPSAAALMQTILDSPSYDIFCCHECRPDFRNTTAGLDGASELRESPTAQRISSIIATLLEESDGEEIPVLSSKQQTRILSWQSETVYAQCPGAFPEALETDIDRVLVEPRDARVNPDTMPASVQNNTGNGWLIDESDDESGSEHDNAADSSIEQPFNTNFEVTEDSSDSDDDYDLAASRTETERAYGELCSLANQIESKKGRSKNTVAKAAVSEKPLATVKELDESVEELEDHFGEISIEEILTQDAVSITCGSTTGPVPLPLETVVPSEQTTEIWHDCETETTRTTEAETLSLVKDLVHSIDCGPYRVVNQGDGVVQVAPVMNHESCHQSNEVAVSTNATSMVHDSSTPPIQIMTRVLASPVPPSSSQLPPPSSSISPSRPLTIPPSPQITRPNDSPSKDARVNQLGAYAWSSNAAENLQSRIERQAEPVVPIVPVVPVLPVVPLASVDSVLSRHNLKQHQVQEPIVETSHRVHTTPGISPSVYMDQAWEKASSVASSVMSTATKQRLLATLPMLKWQDKDGRLLESCCIKGNPAAVRILLKEAKLNPGTKAKPRRAPMSLAIRGRSMKHNKCVRYLLESGADINMRSRDGSTPLHWAIDNADWPGYNNLIYDLLLFSADPNIRDYGGNAPIQKIFDSDATKPLEDHRRIALALLLKTPLKQGVDLKVTMPGSGYSVLHLAVQRRSAIAIGMLINKGADVNVRDTTDTTPLILAANQWRGDLTENQKSMLEQLLSAKTLAVNFQGGSELCTALHYAAKAGAVVAVKALLDCGADAQLRCKRDRTALLWALPGMESSSHSEVVDLLTKAMGLKWSLALDRPVLDQALANKKLLKSILASGFSVDDPLTDGRCLLCAAIDAKMTQAVSAILAHGASTEWMKNNKLVRACDYAEEGGNREIVGLLKAHESKSPTMPSA